MPQSGEDRPSRRWSFPRAPEVRGSAWEEGKSDGPPGNRKIHRKHHAYVDVRGTLTPENFLAGALIIEEAGGVVSDDRGRPLPPFAQMTQGFRVVASANPALHREILVALDSPDTSADTLGGVGA